VQELPRRERLLVIGHYFHERRFDRVAEELGISKSWASRLHRRALRRLHRRLHGVAPVAEPPPVGDGTSACPSRRDLRAPAS
jgi:DNA-directed RNA polymerase specialized sigma24 family protein